MEFLAIAIVAIIFFCGLRVFMTRQRRRSSHPQLSRVPGPGTVAGSRTGISTVAPITGHVNPVRLLSARVSNRIRQQPHHQEGEDGPRRSEEFTLEEIDGLPAYERPSPPPRTREHPATELQLQVEGVTEAADAPPEYSPREEEDPGALPSTVSILMPAYVESEPQPSLPNSDTTPPPLAESATS